VKRPEAKARQLIDRQLDLAGWIVQDALARNFALSQRSNGTAKEHHGTQPANAQRERQDNLQF
jgi:hypothetical protein